MITEATPILSLLFAKGLGAKTLSQLVGRIVEEDLPIGEIVEMPADVLVERFGLSPKLAAAVHASHEQAAHTAEELATHGIDVLIRGVEPYPRHLSDVLGKKSPPILFVKGDLSILGRRAVGFCGARNASEKGIRVAAECARHLAKRDVNVVSGYARGVDLSAHTAALEAGGVTTIVLAEGILHFRAKREVKSLLENDNFLVVSEYSPRLPWSGRNAMQRNETIIGLSDAVICIESGMKGGTFAAAESTLALNLPLFVADYAQPAESAAGNKHFLARGAAPLRGDRNGSPNLSRVFSAIGISQTTNTCEQTGGDLDVAEDVASYEKKGKSVMPNVEPERSSEMKGRYPKRLIEVDLPIARISAHARREKSIRHGHISTLHIWWARRPLSACRAVICAALWPDPADELCPQAFREAAVEQIKQFASRVFPKKITEEGRLLQSEKHLSQESRGRWETIAAGTLTLDANEPADMPMLRFCLLDFIADFANWDNSTVPAYLETSRALTQAAHEALGGVPGTRPLVVDPFAGGGSIPLEALRVGADAFASDLNPVAVLLNKVVLEYIPKYGQRLADEVRKWGQWVKEQAEQELAEFYPKDPDGATPLAYLWARTIHCEGPSCGAEVPLISSLWLARRKTRSVALRLVPRSQTRRIDIEIVESADPSDVGSGTVRRGSATCPICGYTTPVAAVRGQLKERRGGTRDARLLCVVTDSPQREGQFYREASVEDSNMISIALATLEEMSRTTDTTLSLVPDEPLDSRGIRHTWAMVYGLDRWDDYFTARQALALVVLSRRVRDASAELSLALGEEIGLAVQTCLALAVDKIADYGSSIATWMPRGTARDTFARQAIPIVWDFVEANPISAFHCGWDEAYKWVVKVLSAEAKGAFEPGHAAAGSATSQQLPDDSANALITDPPYYDPVPYAYLSDFFYVWLRRNLAEAHPTLFRNAQVPKNSEIVVDRMHQLSNSTHDIAFYESELAKAFADSRRVARPDSLAVIVFASKSTASWEAILKAVVDAGWVITGSWPIDTEREARIAAQGQARLASSVHLVCRPRENSDGSLREEIGEWRDVLSELPKRIHEWMPRLAAEGVVGADAIFACLGPALEIFSRYSRVEKASGEAVPLREYLEQVWAAVSTEALSMIFNLPAGRQGTADPNAAGLEPDARLTAMWLWTLGEMAANGNGKPDADADGEKVVASTGYTLEYDAARKIAQGLGIHLEDSETIVEVKGDKARLLPCSERTRHLFASPAGRQGKDETTATSARGRLPAGRQGKKKKQQQRSLFEELDELDLPAGRQEPNAEGFTTSPGKTVLDRVHQSMILFAAGRGEALRRFLVEDGAGTDARFWKLAQSLSALYPKETDEKRWVDGVLARKKGLGL